VKPHSVNSKLRHLIETGGQLELTSFALLFENDLCNEYFNDLKANYFINVLLDDLSYNFNIV
jgi:hypothetical protein